MDISEHDNSIEQCLQGLKRFSGNIGTHDFSLPRDSEGYASRERLLRDLYKRFGKSAYAEDIYRSFQGLDDSMEADWTDDAFAVLDGMVEGHRGDEGWMRVRSSHERHSDPYWVRVQAEKEDRGYRTESELTKVYVSLKNDLKVSELFIGAVSALLRDARYTFFAKASRFRRADSMCFWVTRTDLHLLEDYFAPRRDALTENLPFIAYRNGLGFGKEMSSWMSQNMAVSDIMEKYFSTKDRAEDVDLGEMYSLAVKGWNRELEEGHPMNEVSGDINAQMLVVLLETMDVITGKIPFDDSCLLLQDDSRLWVSLNDNYDWAEVAEDYLRNGR